MVALRESNDRAAFLLVPNVKRPVTSGNRLFADGDWEDEFKIEVRPSDMHMAVPNLIVGGLFQKNRQFPSHTPLLPHAPSSSYVSNKVVNSSLQHKSAARCIAPLSAGGETLPHIEPVTGSHSGERQPPLHDVTLALPDTLGMS